MKLTKNFSLSEFESKDGADMPNAVLENIKEVASNLQALRDYIGEPIKVNSGYRSPKHNKSIGGVKNSRHIKGQAADICVLGMRSRDVVKAIKKLISEGKMKEGGIGTYETFVHYDIRGTKARW